MEPTIALTAEDLATLDNRGIRERARQLMTGTWNKCALLTLLAFAISGIPSSLPKIGGLISLVISGPLSLGLAIIFLQIAYGKKFDFEDLFKGFSDFARSFIAYILILVFFLLWALLLIVPGIIAAISYSLTFYLLAEHPEMSANEARKRSIVLMNGHKMELFMLGLSFIGWGLLCIPTVGIGLLWLVPYIQTSMALFYRKVCALQPATAGQ